MAKAINGVRSRYKNMEVPIFAGIRMVGYFIDGQIETHSLLINLSQKEICKISNRPWAHQTIAQRETGDKIYPKNIADITKLISNLAEGVISLNLADVAKSELIGWFRYNLNYNGYNKVGEPKIVIPKNKHTWQNRCRFGHKLYVFLQKRE